MSCRSAGLPNCACHVSATQVWGLLLMWERMKSSTRVWCQSIQPMGLHASLGRFRRSASESPRSAGCTKVFVLKVSTFATTVCTSILMLLSPCSCYLELGGVFPRAHPLLQTLRPPPGTSSRQRAASQGEEIAAARPGYTLLTASTGTLVVLPCRQRLCAGCSRSQDFPLGPSGQSQAPVAR